MGDRTIVLSLGTGEYFGLGPSATAIWEGLSTRRPAALTCRDAAAAFHTEIATVELGYAALLSTMIERGWIVENPAGPIPGRTRRKRLPRKALWPRFQAWGSLVAVAARIKVFGFAAGYQHAAAWADSATSVSTIPLVEAVAAFRAAENLFLSGRGPDDCLTRSLSLFVYLRQIGFPASHRIGVADSPFTAHAWVDCDGEAVVEAADRVSRFSVIASLP